LFSAVKSEWADSVSLNAFSGMIIQTIDQVHCTWAVVEYWSSENHYDITGELLWHSISALISGGYFHPEIDRRFGVLNVNFLA